MIIKTCSKHGDLEEKDVKQGVYKGKNYKKCRFCEIDRSRAYYKKMYEHANFVERKHEKDRLRWQEKKKEITKQRQTPEAQQKRREAYHAKKEHYNRHCKDKQKKYREELHDSYVRKVIQNGNKFLKLKDIPQPLIDLKRSLMLLNKGIKKRKNINFLEKNIENK